MDKWSDIESNFENIPGPPSPSPTTEIENTD